MKKEPSTSKVISPKTPESNGQLEAILDKFTQQMRDLQDQIEDLRKRKDDDGGARRFIADKAYDPSRKQLAEFSVISNSAVEPFALSMTCGAVLDPKVLSGEVSLCDIYLEHILRLLRGKSGKLLQYAAEQAKEEAQKTAEGIGADIADARGL